MASVGAPMMGGSMMGGPMMGSPAMGNPMMGNSMMGNPMMGSGMMGNPMIASGMMGSGMMGNPMMGNPMMGNPMMGNPMMGGPMMGGQGPGSPSDHYGKGQQAPPQFGRAFMFPLDPPRTVTLEEKPVVPNVQNFRPPPPMLPAQGSSFNPVLAGAVGERRAPNAYRNYQYGKRVVYWANPVTVPENNTGIMVNAEFPMQSWMEGRLLDPNKPGTKELRGDHFIRNEHWMMLNPSNLKPYSEEEAAKLDPQHTFGEYQMAMDIGDVPRAQGLKAEEYIEEKYKKMHEEREDRGFFSIDKIGMRNMELEILDEQDLREFWANPNAIIQDTLE